MKQYTAQTQELLVVIIIIIIRSECKHRHACFRRAVSQSTQCRLQGTVVSVIIVFILDFFVFVLFRFLFFSF